MTPRQMKGALLEYMVRQLLGNCGFTSAKADGHYVYQEAGTGKFFINGKGAAHDADVLMNPPIQMPFTYPSQLLYECKAYEKAVGLDVVRNALGLRYDINEFEILSDAAVAARKTHTRIISNRPRFNYQVGVASVDDFSKNAIEFASNNKISIISLRWFLSEATCKLFSRINTEYLEGIEPGLRGKLYAYLKDRAIDVRIKPEYGEVREFMETDEEEVIGEIVRQFESVLGKSCIGLTETGDILFLFANNAASLRSLLSDQSWGVRVRLHWYEDDPETWTVTLESESDLLEYPADGRMPLELTFKVPQRIMEQWKEFDLSKSVALDLKANYFSRLFLFSGRRQEGDLPFVVLNLDKDWHDRLRNNPLQV